MITSKISEGKSNYPNELGFKFTRFIIIKESDFPKLFCNKCKEKIDPNSWIYICDDENKLWHEKHFENWHDKIKFNNTSGLQDHEDKLYFLKIAHDNDFENIGSDKIIELNL